MVNSKKTNLRVILIVLLVVFSSLLTIVLYLFPTLKQSYSENEVKKIYFAENITEAHSILIEEFNQQNKDEIEVIPINLPYEKFSTNKRKELITKNLRNRTSRIDIYAIDVVWNERFKKWAEPLNNYFSKSELSEILDEAKYYCYSDSILYSVPFFIDIGILYYREDLLKQSSFYENIIPQINDGITWNELEKYNSVNGKLKYLFQADSYEGLMCNFFEFVGDNSLIYDNGKVTFNKNIGDKLSTIHNLIYDKRIIPKEVIEFDESKTFNYALKNDVPFFRGWPTGIRNIKLDEGIQYKLKYLKYAPLPRFANQKSASTIGGWNLIVSKNSSFKKESIKFLKFLLSKKSQEFIWRKNGYLPVQNHFFSNPKFLEEFPEIKLFHELIENGVYRIKHKQYTKISDILTSNLNLFFSNKISIDEFTSNSLEKIKPIIEAN